MTLAVADDGIGFDPAMLPKIQARGRLGLVGIRERVERLRGRLELISQPQQGTELLVTIPLAVPAGSDGAEGSLT